jgi:hypothetical protein
MCAALKYFVVGLSIFWLSNKLQLKVMVEAAKLEENPRVNLIHLFTVRINRPDRLVRARLRQNLSFSKCY